MTSLMTLIALVSTTLLGIPGNSHPEPMEAGVARVDITHPEATRVNDPCFARALVLSQGATSVALVTVDAVAIGGIGAIPDSFMNSLRQELARDPGIPAAHLIVNASHCHGTVRGDAVGQVAQAVRDAWNGRTRVKVGTGRTTEHRISENRRVTLKDGSQVDMRRAYSLAWDRDIAAVGPIDPEVGLVRIDREDGRPLAVLYHFACHPIMNPPSKGSSADFPGSASALIEKSLGGAMAFFIQGCGGDINPVRYKDVQRSPDAEPLGLLLGSRVLAGVQGLTMSSDVRLSVDRRLLTLPRAADYQSRIDRIRAERNRLVESLKGTNINFKTLVPLLIQQRLDPEFPAADAQAYLHERDQRRDDLSRLDAENRSQVETYLANVRIMEQLTRLNTNLALLEMHQAQTDAAAIQTIDVEVCALRLGDFKLVTFPGELTVEVGLNIKKAARQPLVFVSGYTNGYIYYTPTTEQRLNPGYAQEDCDCLVAPEWQQIFERNALELIGSP